MNPRLAIILATAIPAAGAIAYFGPVLAFMFGAHFVMRSLNQNLEYWIGLLGLFALIVGVAGLLASRRVYRFRHLVTVILAGGAFSAVRVMEKLSSKDASEWLALAALTAFYLGVLILLYGFSKPEDTPP